MIRAPKVRWIAPAIAACLLWSSTPSRAQDTVEYPPVGHSSPVRVMFESLLIPGWGQIENESYLKAVLFFGTYATFVQWGIRLNQDKQDAVGRLAGASEDELSAFEAEVDRLSDARNSKYWYAGLTAVVAMADAFVDAHLKKFDERMDSDIAMTHDGFQVGLRWSFSGGDR